MQRLTAIVKVIHYADFPAASFQLCHGTNENLSTEKLSRAINHRSYKRFTYTEIVSN